VQPLLQSNCETAGCISDRVPFVLDMLHIVILLYQLWQFMATCTWDQEMYFCIGMSISYTGPLQSKSDPVQTVKAYYTGNRGASSLVSTFGTKERAQFHAPAALSPEKYPLGLRVV
jgi:hypothetical protein